MPSKQNSSALSRMSIGGQGSFGGLVGAWLHASGENFLLKLWTSMLCSTRRTRSGSVTMGSPTIVTTRALKAAAIRASNGIFTCRKPGSNSFIS